MSSTTQYLCIVSSYQHRLKSKEHVLSIRCKHRSWIKYAKILRMRARYLDGALLGDGRGGEIRRGDRARADRIGRSGRRALAQTPRIDREDESGRCWLVDSASLNPPSPPHRKYLLSSHSPNHTRSNGLGVRRSELAKESALARREKVEKRREREKEEEERVALAHHGMWAMCVSASRPWAGGIVAMQIDGPDVVGHGPVSASSSSVSLL